MAAPGITRKVADAIVAAFADKPMKLDVRYQNLAAAKAEDRVVVGVIQAFGLPIVAIGMIGLVSAMTTTVLERTKEIGILRAIGLSDEDMGRWHARFERDAPAAHHAFLRWLGIEEEEALAIRARSRA